MVARLCYDFDETAALPEPKPFVLTSPKSVPAVSVGPARPLRPLPAAAAPSVWTDERIAQLRQLWQDGNSASMCARSLNCTRNAVIGKVHRLDMPKRISTQFARAKAKPKKYVSGQFRKSRAKQNVVPFYGSREPVIRKVAMPPPLPPNCEPVRLLARSIRGCCYPVGIAVGAEQMFCDSASNGTAYCAYHARVMYRPVEQRRRAA